MAFSDYLYLKRKAILMATNLFWLPSGVSRADVLAAYQFKGVPTEAESLVDITGNGRNLTKTSQTYSGTTHTPTWDTTHGWTFDHAYQAQTGYLDNSTLDGLNIVSAVVRFDDVTQTYDRVCLISAGGSSGYAQIMARTAIWEDSQVKTYAGGGYVSGSGKWHASATYHSDGVYGANFGSANKLYYNGSVISTTEHSATTSMSGASTIGSHHAGISDLNNATWGGKRIQAAVFFSVALTDAQHYEVAQRMLEI